MLNIIFFITLYPLLFVFFFLIKFQYKQEDRYLFSVSIEKEWLEEEQIKEIIRKFKRQTNIIFILLLFVPFFCLVTEHESIQLTIWMMWILFVIFLFYLPFLFACHKLKLWKKEHHLYKKESSYSFSEIKNAGSVRRVTFLPFFIPTLVSFLAALLPLPVSSYSYASGFFTAQIIIAFCTPVYWLMGYIIDRQPVEVISYNSDVNINFTRAKKNVWKNFWVICCWLNTCFLFAIDASFFMKHQNELCILISAIVYCVLLLLLCIPLTKNFQRIHKQYMDKQDFQENYAEDDCWIGGIFYYNPKDHRSMVDKKVGIGTTVNIATPLGKCFTIVGVIAFLVLPLTCIFVIMEEFTPISLTVENDTLIAEHIKVEYEIPIDNIENPQQIDTLPSMTKSNGSAMKVLRKGDFYIRGQGHCQVLLNPQNKLYISFTANDEQYYISGFDDAQTMEIYDIIMKQ